MVVPIRHEVRFRAPESHYVEVASSFPCAEGSGLDLAMAVWTPGSYLIREYARHVEGISARADDGSPLRIAKTCKNRWRVETGSAERAVIRYRLYARELSVRTNFVDADFALLSGAASFLVPVGGHHLAAELHLELPPPWRTVVSPLVSPAEGLFVAASYDELVDAPIYAGNAPVHRFVVEDREHLLVNEGEDERWNAPRALSDLSRIVATAAAFWGALPYERYVIFNLLTEGGGGLEHRDSCVLMASRLKTRRADGYLDWLGLVVHELFHAWNVKRLRPIEFDRFDYEAEVYTPSLWIAEGFTTYYEDLMLHRAGFVGPAGLLERLSKTIESVEAGPGRLVQGLDAASFDAWIKYYRKDENFPNSGVSYYTKGAVVALLLDAQIRTATRGERSLDDAMRLAYDRFSGARGYRQEEMIATLEEVAGRPLAAWIERALAPGQLDYTPALEAFGLRFADEPKEGAEPAAWLGLDAEPQGGRLLVSHVVRGGPAVSGGVAAGDEILAIDDDRVPSDGLAERLRGHRPGEAATLLVSRRERLRRLPIVFGAKPRTRGRLEIDPAATPEQRVRLAGWLEGAPAGRLEPAVTAVVTTPGDRR